MTDVIVFKHILAIVCPALMTHFSKVDLDVTSLLINWFMCLFALCFPLEVMAKETDNKKEEEEEEKRKKE
jgi:hypothetical protein